MKWIFIFMALCAVWWIGFEIELYEANKQLEEEAKELMKERHTRRAK